MRLPSLLDSLGRDIVYIHSHHGQLTPSRPSGQVNYSLTNYSLPLILYAHWLMVSHSLGSLPSVSRALPLLQACWDGRLTPIITGQPSPNPGSVHQIRYGNSNGGLVTLADTQTIEVLAHFARERIPER